MRLRMAFKSKDPVFSIAATALQGVPPVQPWSKRLSVFVVGHVGLWFSDPQPDWQHRAASLRMTPKKRDYFALAFPNSSTRSRTLSTCFGSVSRLPSSRMGINLSNSGPECDPVITIRMG